MVRAQNAGKRQKSMGKENKKTDKANLKGNKAHLNKKNDDRETKKKNLTCFKDIKNKEMREKLFWERKVEKAKEKLLRRKRKKQNPNSAEFQNLPKQHTIESLREYDELHPPPVEIASDIQTVNDDNKDQENTNAEQNKNEHVDIADEFSDYFNKNVPPKVAITISSDKRASKTLHELAAEVSYLIPNSFVLIKRGMPFRKFIKQCEDNGYTDVILFGEDKKQPNRMIICHIPNGGLTAMFKLTSLKLSSDIQNHGRPTIQKPEIILNNFTTALGHRLGTMFAALFPHLPEFQGRQVVTFHNQRDFIFFRYHRYIFESGEKVRTGLQELGPRFTLKLKWLQNGIFNTKNPKYEWFLHRHKMETSRRMFFL